MPARPAVIVFDVNETLSDMAPLAYRFAEVGAPGHLAALWFATVLRDGFALAAAGANVAFGTIGENVLRGLLDAVPDAALPGGRDGATRHILAGLTELSVHPDVASGIRALRADGHRLMTLSNGPASVATELLTSAGIIDEFEGILSVQDAPQWKPARSAYSYAVAACRVLPEELLLVAVHPWDLHGAATAGLQTAWLDRAGSRYPAHFVPPTHRVKRLDELAAALRVTNSGTIA